MVYLTQPIFSFVCMTMPASCLCHFYICAVIDRANADWLRFAQQKLEFEKKLQNQFFLHNFFFKIFLEPGDY